MTAAADSPEGRPRPPQNGICDSCRHQKLIHNRRGSVFSLCRRSKIDPRYPKYPRVPVLSCPGHEPGSEEEPV